MEDGIQSKKKGGLVEEHKLDLYKKGMEKYIQQDLDGAIVEFNKALELDPQFGDVHQAMAHVFEKKGDLNKAIEAAQKAVDCNPNDSLAHTSLSMFYQRKGMIPEAEREQAIAAQINMRGKVE